MPDRTAIDERHSLPLTPVQHGMLVASQSPGARGIYVEQVVGELDEACDPGRFCDAWLIAIRSFDALRLRFRWPQRGAPEQRVGSAGTLEFSVVDLRGSAAPARVKIEDFLAADRDRGIDVRSDALMRVSVLQLGQQAWAFVWTAHHAIIDGTSYPTVLRCVFDAYDGLAPAGPAPGAPSFAAFVRWLASCDVSESLTRFDALLEGFEAPTPLPLQTGTTDQPVRTTSELRGRLPAPVTASLLEAARAAGATPNTLVQLAWGLLLCRYAGTDDVVFSTTWSGRSVPLAGVERVVGPCVNSLPVRVTIPPGDTVRDAIARLRAQHVALRADRHVPLQALGDGRGSRRSHLRMATNVVFDATRLDTAFPRDDDRWARRRFWSRSRTSFALGLAAHLAGEELVLDLEYDTDRYSDSVARRLLAEYERVLASLAERPLADPLGLPLLAPATEAELTTVAAAREGRATADTPLLRILEVAAATPDAVAVVQIDGVSVTYRELVDRAVALAARTWPPGVARPGLVGVLVPRSIDAIVAVLAVHAGGGAFLPLDPSYPPGRLSYIVADAGLTTVLVTAATAGRVPGAAGVERRIDDGAVEPVAPHHVAAPDPDDLAYVIYTSGSTGEPKGVCIPHGALASHAHSAVAIYELRPSDRVLQFTPLSVDVSIEEIFPTLAAGATLVLRDEVMSNSARHCFATLDRLGVTVANLPTAFWQHMVRSAAATSWPDALRLVIVGGERVVPGDLQAFREAGTSHIRWINGYGPTEATITSTSYDDAEGAHDASILPIGRPWPGVSHFLLDRHRRPVPPGAVGELFIGGGGLASGYLHRPQLTAERFVEHPFRPGARLYATGDLAWKTDAGHYVFVGRRDDQVKIRGFRVELGEIEAVLRRHPSVADTAVVVRKSVTAPAELWGFVVAAQGGAVIADLRARVAQAVPGHMVPRLCVVDALPRTPAGKVDREALAAGDWPVAEEATATGSTTPEVEKLQRIWSEILGTPVSDSLVSFFELGGHSLLVAQMLVRVEQGFNRTFDVQEFLRTPTIQHLATLVNQGQDADWAAPLITLSPGHPQNRPLFLTPGVSGWGLDYAHLADALHPDLPVHALQSRGLRRGQVPHHSLSEAAEEYADVIRATQPRGPYGLAGFSAGAVVALAVADTLHRRGERTDFVGLVDAVPPASIAVASPFADPHRFARLCRAVFGRLRAQAARGRWPDAAKRVGQMLRRHARRAFSRGVDESIAVEDLFAGLDIRLSRAQADLMQAHLDAVIAYRPAKDTAVDVVLFRTTLDPIEGPYEADFGWHRVTRGAVTVVHVPGDHDELLTAAGAPGVARLMEPFLQGRRST